MKESKPVEFFTLLIESKMTFSLVLFLLDNFLIIMNSKNEV